MNNWTENLAEYFKDICPLIECFLTIGLEEKDFQNHFEFGEKLEAKVISQFPPKNACRINIPETLPTFCFPNGVELVKNREVPASTYSNILTDEHGELLYCSVLKVFEPYLSAKRSSIDFTLDIQELPAIELGISTSASLEKTDAVLDSPRTPSRFSFYCPEGLLVPKGLVILSKQPLFQTYQNILLNLYKLSKKTLSLPMECYISHLVLQVPLPSRGHVIIHYFLGREKLAISLPQCNKLPVLDVNLGILFNSLDLENVLTLFRNIIIEKSTVFVSESEEKLISCTYSMLSLLFPMHWNMVYVPILPCTLLDYLYSPVTFVFGVHAKYIDDVFTRVNDSVCIVDLDNNRFLVSDTPAYHRKNSVNFILPKLPDHYGKKLRKKVEATLTKSGITRGKSIKLAKAALDYSSALSIRNNFFQFFVSILIDYKKFMIFEPKVGCTDTFNSTTFLHSCSDKDFMSCFIETQMFSNFCESRIRPKNVEEHCEGLLFDEEIIAKVNRFSLNFTKTTVTFIYDKSQDHNTTYSVPTLETFFKSSNLYSYKKFPDFNYDEINQYEIPNIKPPKYAESIDKKSSVTPNWRTNSECLLTSWMDLWGLLISSQHSSEHNTRIHELVMIAERLQHCTTMPTISLYKYLLERCFVTQPSIALPIFSFMSTAKIPADAETLQLLQKIVSKLYASDQNIVMHNTGTNLLITKIENEQMAEIKLKRVFTKPEDVQVFAKQEVSFLIKETCKKCSRVLKADDISQKWSKAEYNYESACISCEEKILPKLVIRVGLEIGYYKETPTSTREETLFVSPQALRKLISDLILSQKDLELEQLRCGYPMIFWNAIYYFYINNLPFDFLLMYDNEEQSSDIFLTTEELKGGWNYDVTSKSSQTELSFKDIQRAEKKYTKFENVIENMIFI